MQKEKSFDMIGSLGFIIAGLSCFLMVALPLGLPFEQGIKLVFLALLWFGVECVGRSLLKTRQKN